MTQVAEWEATQDKVARAKERKEAILAQRRAQLEAASACGGLGERPPLPDQSDSVPANRRLNVLD